MKYFHFAIRTGTARRVREGALLRISDRFGVEGPVELVSVQSGFRLYRIGYFHTDKTFPLRH